MNIISIQLQTTASLVNKKKLHELKTAG